MISPIERAKKYIEMLNYYSADIDGIHFDSKDLIDLAETIEKLVEALERP